MRTSDWPRNKFINAVEKMAPQDQAFAAAAAAGNLALMERYLFPKDLKRRSAKKGIMEGSKLFAFVIYL